MNAIQVELLRRYRMAVDELLRLDDFEHGAEGALVLGGDRDAPGRNRTSARGLGNR